VLAVERADLVLGDEADRKVPLVDAGRAERCLGRRMDRGIARDLDLDRYERCSRDEYSS
jgi:hypothetical protein